MTWERWCSVFTEFLCQWENPGDDADQLIGKMNLKLIRPVLVRHLEAICIIDMKFWDWLDCSKEKYIKDLGIDVYRIAIYTVKKINWRNLFRTAFRKAAGLLGDDQSILLDAIH